MSRRHAPLPPPLATPLFFAEELSELDRLEAERDALLALIRKLPPRSYMRIIRQHELTRITHQMLRVQIRLHGSAT